METHFIPMLQISSSLFTKSHRSSVYYEIFYICLTFGSILLIILISFSWDLINISALFIVKVWHCVKMSSIDLKNVRQYVWCWEQLFVNTGSFISQTTHRLSTIQYKYNTKSWKCVYYNDLMFSCTAHKSMWCSWRKTAEPPTSIWDQTDLWNMILNEGCKTPITMLICIDLVKYNEYITQYTANVNDSCNVVGILQVLYYRPFLFSDLLRYRFRYI